MSVRGRHFLSRMLITFDPRGGSSRGMMEYLQRSGLELKERVEGLGGQLFVEVRPSHHPEIRVCYMNGMHLNDVAKAEHKRHLFRTSELRWRADTTNRIRNRRRNFKMTEHPPFVTRTPADEKRELAARLVASDTMSGRARNAAELSNDMHPDRGDNYNILSLLTQRGSLKHELHDTTEYEVKARERGYRWPAWKVWGPSSKQLIARNLNEKEIAIHLWWLTSTAGQRSSKWGNNIERHRPVRPSIQGKWNPSTAARLNHSSGAFGIRELSWADIPEPTGRGAAEDEALRAAPFIDRASSTSPKAHSRSRITAPQDLPYKLPTDIAEDLEAPHEGATNGAGGDAESYQESEGTLRDVQVSTRSKRTVATGESEATEGDGDAWGTAGGAGSQRGGKL